MSEKKHVKPEDGTAIFYKLDEKFTQNLISQLKTSHVGLEQIELRARGVSAIGKILLEKHAVTETQKECCAIYDEVFADVITSVYLAACALDKPAQMVLRRAFELGIASVYLWDQPHVFWGWKHCDKDLNFNDMLVHLDSDVVRTFISARNTSFKEEDHLFDLPEARRIYRALSNTVHGKIAFFETTQIQSRFSANNADWNNHIDQVNLIQDILYNLWMNTFSNLANELKANMPQFNRFK